MADPLVRQSRSSGSRGVLRPGPPIGCTGQYRRPKVNPASGGLTGAKRHRVPETPPGRSTPDAANRPEVGRGQAASDVATDDPIVRPGEAGASHQHEFFGNRTTDADSTYASLRAGGTTCRILADTAAYWVPSLYADGRRVAPLKVNAYYLRGRGPGRIVAFPPGLKVIAGDSGATTAQSGATTGWKCSGIQPSARSAEPTTCPSGSHNVLVIRFPDCWNGRDLDSADHWSHMAYRVAGSCPAGYPVRVPRLSLNVHYELASVTGLTLASGSIHSAHADFFNAWNQTTLARLVRVNLN